MNDVQLVMAGSLETPWISLLFNHREILDQGWEGRGSWLWNSGREDEDRGECC